jgi:mRNA interferase MazF
MNRGDVWWVNFDPSVGSEIKKIRPAIIISNDSANRHLSRVQVIPLTSNVARLYPGEAKIVLNGEIRKAMGNQIMTVSKQRISRQIGRVSDDDMRLVENAIRVQLGLDHQ